MMPPDLARPCRIMVAPNGARRTKADHPALPITPEELAREAAACRDAGASAIHLHARDGEGNHTLDPEIYRTFVDAVEAAVGDSMLVQCTTEAVGRYSPAEQMAAMRRLRPRAVSLAIRELIPEDGWARAVAGFLDWLHRESIEPQYILYDVADVRRFDALCRRGIIPGDAPSVLFVLGRYARGDDEVQPRALLEMLEAHDPARPWSVCAFGRAETACLTLAACLGGDVRVGFENSLVHADGRIAESNAAKVAELRGVLRAIGRGG